MNMRKEGYSLPDFRLLVIAYVIIAFGLSMVYSASIQISKTLYDNQYAIFKNQLIWFVTGTVFLLVTMNLPSRFYERFSRWFLFVNLFLLILVLFPSVGHRVAGSRSWIRFGMFGFQPSELVKITLILYLASMFNRSRINVESFFEGYLPPLIVSTVVFFLILLQPDVGSAFLVAVIIGLLFFVSGIRIRFLVVTVFTMLPFIYLLVSKVAYRKMRLLTYINPSRDPVDSGYHILQSIKCFQTAGFFGRGIGNGVQKLYYLPQAHTDFIFSVIGEETGLLGGSVLLLLFVYMLSRSVRITLRTPDKFGFLAGTGICIMWAVQILVNIFVSVGLIPITGLPLPFISYGGSSLVVNMIALGVLLSLSRSARREA